MRKQLQHFHLPGDVRPHALGLGDERLLVTRIEPHLLIESQRSFVFSAGEQHDLVAILAPSVTERVRENCSAPALTAVHRMSDDILDYAVWAAGAREVWNDCYRTTRNERARGEASKVLDSRVRKSLRPNFLGNCGRRRRVVALVQVRIQTEQRLKLV